MSDDPTSITYTTIDGESATDSNILLKLGTNFGVSNSGVLYATNANITGKINATTIKANDGSIGGWSIGTTSLSSTNVTLSSASGTTSKAINVNGGTFYVQNNGYMYASSGLIGGWNINGSTLSGGGVTLNSNAGSISGTGFTLNSSGASITQGTITLGSGFSVTSAGILNATGATLTNLKIVKDLTVEGSVNSTGNASFTGTASFTGNTDIGGTLSVTKESTFSGNTSIGGTLKVTGAVEFENASFTVNGAEACNKPLDILVDAPWFNSSVRLQFENGLLVGFDSDASISWDDFWGGANSGDVPYCSKEEYDTLLKKVEDLESTYKNHVHSFSGSDTMYDTYRTAPSLSYDSTTGKVSSWSAGSSTYQTETISISGDTGKPKASS
jgi:hypothetical protein